MGGTEAAKPSRKARLARSVRLPVVSGKLSALVLVACFALTAVIFFPLARGIDPWIRFDVVLLLWWMIWLLTLTMLLYSGNRISDDHRLSLLAGRVTLDDLLSFNFSELGEGCLMAIVSVLAAVVVAIGAWLLIEI